MKGLATLIRLRKNELDELQKKKIGLEQNRAELETALEKLKQEVAEEARLAGEDLNLAPYFAGFIEKARKREEGIRRGIQLLDTELEKLMEHIREAFGELKKLEIAQELERQKEREHLARIEQANMDEMGQRGFLKEQEEQDES